MIDIEIDRIVRTALAEDLGLAGDLTTAVTIDPERAGTAHIVCREDGVLSGSAAASRAFAAVDPSLAVEWFHRDADRLRPGDRVATITGSAASILTAERTALNLLGHLSGIASRTASIVQLVEGTGAQIADTRKTTPGLRALEKRAVLDGGGVNHRFGLHDAILVKDNHIGLGGGLEVVLSRLAERSGHLVRVEIEVDTLDQLDTVLIFDRERIERGHSAVVHAVLLDNMRPEQIRNGAARIAKHPAPLVLEVSGGVTEASVRPLAEAGAQIISIGALTHSVTCLDFGLDL
ncbi:carboxylating nicotinate-nucleotide diphosphorylase [Yimella sp. cx-51]|uniref:carboxylating nicotinate-nucleotide diphosphorylase n=1 Tax=Yimella sp. cx-51 TaxID=2770551 RepID=UPI00165E33E9|nr:carboxylating nicotinate-nucleotide diphosphorylase [Yimella sp. cx-51]MBC9956892.1 carboxylating nicotinate-nucleotide diphosphorylase [Yimella sp. cx-51]QTH39114.1 carboxylating nicotinate-nucleotide diphosphorylase [Yimella sp. cx-51]